MKMESCWFVKLCLLFLSLIFNVNCFSPVVETTSGPVQGIKVFGRDVYRYASIPYAKPPVHELRFKKPEPVEPWKGIYHAVAMPPACYQYSDYPSRWYNKKHEKSEDCLYLNIWTPFSAQDATVMFWIHGGNFSMGSSREARYDAKVIADLGKVVVVTLNYRLNVFGFLYSATEDAPGNVGLYDIVFALQWVRDNIKAFGGDPNQITLFGQSSGSISVGILCLSPLTKGMFHRVIMESASPDIAGQDSKTGNLARSQQIAVAAGCADDDNTISNNPEAVVECLRGTDAMKLMKILATFSPTCSYLSPVYGDELIPDNPEVLLKEGEFQDADVLIGSNKDEGSFMLLQLYPNEYGSDGEKDFKTNKSYGEQILRSQLGNFEGADDVIQYYLGDLDDNDYDGIRHNVYTAVGDLGLLCPTVYFAENYNRAGKTVHYYFFVHRPSNTEYAEWVGVAHSDELPFVFGLPLQAPENYTKEEVDLSTIMVEVWTNFAKYGELFIGAWPHYSRQNPIYVQLDILPGIKLGRGPHEDNCNFLRKYYDFD